MTAKFLSTRILGSDINGMTKDGNPHVLHVTLESTNMVTFVSSVNTEGTLFSYILSPYSFYYIP